MAKSEIEKVAEDNFKGINTTLDEKFGRGQWILMINDGGRPHIMTRVPKDITIEMLHGMALELSVDLSKGN